MGKKLVIVESPTKAKTIKYILGSEYIVTSTLGHIRDLPEHTFGVDLETFTPAYEILPGKKKIVAYLKKLVGQSDSIFLATDEDREGEAIAWHTATVLDKDINEVKRVAFHEITKDAVVKSFKNPRTIDMNLVSAQQARRILDRIVGYSISPLLGKNLSAGRVQSVALQMIVIREKEIQNFIPEPYWTIYIIVEHTNKQFKMKMVSINGEKIGQQGLKNKEQVKKHINALKNRDIVIKSVDKTIKNIRPYPPFTTSSLQQEASIKLGFNSSKTMLIAQKLYEGLPLEKKRPVGLITYMRTDSPSVSKIAQNQAARFINENFGSQYLPAKPPYYIARLSSAQEAHEAIRPTHIDIPPEQIKKYLNRDYYAVYKLIWDRFIASQMTPAKVETITIVADAGEYTFEAFKSNRIFDGFTMIWPIKTDEGEKNIPPDITATDRIKLVDIISEEEKTKPPARYTEASLIKTLEKFGIGRPSTYAPIISTLFKRKYIRKNGKSFIPEKLGIMVSEMLSRYFSDIINVQFTAKMEKELDEIAEGEKNWIELLKNFYKRFKIYLDKATSEANFKIADSIEQQKNIPEPMGKNCPKCGKPLVIRTSRYGKFIGCTGFPKCRYIEKIEK